MRRFSSYGPVNTKLHYYAQREELIDRAYTQLVGENPQWEKVGQAESAEPVLHLISHAQIKA